MPVSTSPTTTVCNNNSVCTVDCLHRPRCTKKRFPLLIPAIVINYRTGKIYPDEYINELAELRRDSLDNACLSGGKKLRDNYATKLKLEAI